MFSEEELAIEKAQESEDDPTKDLFGTPEKKEIPTRYALALPIHALPFYSC